MGRLVERWYDRIYPRYCPPFKAKPSKASRGCTHEMETQKEKLAAHRPWVSTQVCLLEDLLQRQRKDLKRSWVSPNRQQRKGFLPAPQPWMNCLPDGDGQ